MLFVCVPLASGSLASRMDTLFKKGKPCSITHPHPRPRHTCLLASSFFASAKHIKVPCAEHDMGPVLATDDVLASTAAHRRTGSGSPWVRTGTVSIWDAPWESARPRKRNLKQPRRRGGGAALALLRPHVLIVRAAMNWTPSPVRAPGERRVQLRKINHTGGGGHGHGPSGPKTPLAGSRPGKNKHSQPAPLTRTHTATHWSGPLTHQRAQDGLPCALQRDV